MTVMVNRVVRDDPGVVTTEPRPPYVLAQLRDARPELGRILFTAFGSANWGLWARRAHAREHCRIVERLGPPFDVAPGEYFDLLRLPQIGPDVRLMVDQPRWLLRDGLLAISLWERNERMFTLSLTFGEDRHGLIAYVGSIQGRYGPHVLERYRSLTKAAHRMRPRDLLIDLFRMVCREIGVTRIVAVSNRTRYQRSLYYRVWKRADDVTLDYDAIWTDRGATLRKDGSFDVPVRMQSEAQIHVPARKRGMYRARREMMTEIAATTSAILSLPGRIVRKLHVGGEAFERMPPRDVAQPG